MWDPQVNHFKGQYRILRYDTRGHGKSEPISGAYTLDMLANDVVELWNALGIEKSHFVGLSLGGMAAQSLALHYPERLNSIAICDSRADCPEAYRSNWHQRIVGAQDGGTPPEASQAMQKEVAGSQYMEIDPAAHVSNMENPIAFNKTLDDFLSELKQ